MKRTLTAAAAVLVGGAGAVGFAATANAAGTPQLPAELPTDNNLAQTTYHFAGALHSAKQTVGDVVPLEQQQPPAGRSGNSPLGDITGALENGSVTEPLGPLPVGGVLPAGQTLPAAKSGGELLPPFLGTEQLTGPQPGVPQTKPAPLPAEPQNVDLVGEALKSLASSTPLGITQQLAPRGGDPLGIVGAGGNPLGALTGPESPLTGLTNSVPLAKTTPVDPVAPLDKVNDLLTHGPLGGAHQLGG